MTTFERAIEEVLQWEGGYVCDPDDPGGETNFGICKRSYPEVDIRGLTRAAAIALYRKDFWDPRYEKLPPLLATKILDMTVNLGRAAGIRLVQSAINDVRREIGGVMVTVDGQFGPQTLMALTLMNPLLALRAMRARQAQHYAELALARPEQAKFLGGWMRRAVAAAALVLALGTPYSALSPEALAQADTLERMEELERGDTSVLDPSVDS